jgi:hypothetical protein
MTADRITWVCHVCGREREDADISVRRFKVGEEITVNVRYCNDTQACYDGAENVQFLRTARETFATRG